MNSRSAPILRRRLAAIALATVALLAPACESPMPYRAGDQARQQDPFNPVPTHHAGGSTPNAGVSRSDSAILRPDAVVEHDFRTRYADDQPWYHARRDHDLNVSPPAPLRATEQWPEPAKRVERPFRFRTWRFN